MAVSQPVFRENMETSSILAQNTIQMMAEIPDTQKAFISQPASSFTEAGANYQMPNLNSWFIGEIEKVWTRKYIFKGTTIEEGAGGPLPLVTKGTSPYLWSPLNSTVDGFCLNKSTNEIKYTVGNKAWTETDRTNPEMIDIFATQFNQEMVKSYGIYGESMAKSMEHNQSEVMGTPIFQPMNKYMIDSAEIPNGSSYGINDYMNQNSINNQAFHQNSKGYVVVKSVKFSAYAWSGASPVGGALITYPSSDTSSSSTLTTSYVVPGYEGIPVPTLGSLLLPFYVIPKGKRGVVGSVAEIDVTAYANGGYLLQEVELEIHEWVISPHLSNPYSKNPHKKIYYTNGYPLNLTFSFNKNYVKDSLLKWQGNRSVPTSDITGFGDFTGATLWSITDERWGSNDQNLLRLWTFDTAKPLPEVPIKTVYFRQNRQTPAVGQLNRSGVGSAWSKFTQSISTSNLSSIDPYIIIYNSVTQSNNPNYFQYSTYLPSNTTQTILQTSKPYIELLDIDEVEIKVGTQADSLGDSKTLPKSELVKMTLDVIGNPEFRQMLQGTEHYEVMRSLSFSGQDQAVNFANVTDFSPKLARNRGFPFYIIDVAKLNLRLVDGLPLVPRVNYGNTNFKALTIRCQSSATQQMFENKDYVAGGTSPVLQLTAEMHVILMEQRIKTLPLFSGMMQDNEVEFQIDQVSGELLSAINGNYSDMGDNQLSYIGGGFAPWDFLKGLYSDAKSFLTKHARPIAQKVVDIARSVGEHAKGREGLEDVSRVADTISSVGKRFGMGSKYSRA